MKPRDYTKLKELLTVAVGTSIDAFAVGISFALLEIKIWLSGCDNRCCHISCFHDCNQDWKISRSKAGTAGRDYRRAYPDRNRNKDISGAYARTMRITLLFRLTYPSTLNIFCRIQCKMVSFQHPWVFPY